MSVPQAAAENRTSGTEYRIVHTTSYRYSNPVSVCHNVLMLSPRETKYLHCSHHHLLVRPTPRTTDKRVDMFGNIITRFSLEENHSRLTITSTSKVTVLAQPAPTGIPSPTCEEVSRSLREQTDPNWLSVVPFLYNSPRITRDDVFAEFSRSEVTADRPIVDAVSALSSKIHREFSYDPSATEVDTPTEQAFLHRHGVCQDFAHVAVACLRSVGIPARYVSGYLRTIPPAGKERLVGADQSHAWFAAYCGPRHGWIKFDPTNNCLVGGDHVPISTGRDYSDVVPIKGVFLGGGDPQLTVSVDVEPVRAKN